MSGALLPVALPPVRFLKKVRLAPESGHPRLNDQLLGWLMFTLPAHARPLDAPTD
jgi:hypothetical protein